MKTIIYATDCTINDASSLQYAYRFSSIMKANLHVLHVYEFPPISFSSIQHQEILRKRMHIEKKEILEKYCNKHLKNEFNPKTITSHVIENDSIAKSVYKLSKVLKPDLILIGKKDNYSTRAYFTGNIADTLLDKIKIPLLIIPNGMDYKTLSTIVYATDFEKEDFLSIQKLITIAKPFSALIEIIHIYETDESPVKEQMKNFKNKLLEQVSYPEITFRNIASTKIKSGLLSVLNNEKASMLAMLERKHNWGFNNWFRKDLVKDLEAVVKIPILAFNKQSTKIKFQNVKVPSKKKILTYYK